nr:hypothetical protein [Pseudalkalibacillus decolorationis]
MKAEVDHLISLVDTAEGWCQSLNSILNSPPTEFVESIIKANVDVESIFNQIRKLLNDLKTGIDELTNNITNIITNQIPELFTGVKNFFVDAVVGELKAHYYIIDGNKDKVLDHVTQFKTQVHEVGNAFQNRDQTLAQAIENKGGLLSSVDKVQQSTDFKLRDSPHMIEEMRIKEIHLDIAFSTFATGTRDFLLPIIGTLRMVAVEITQLLDQISMTVKGVTNISLSGTIPGFFISKLTDYDDKIRNYVNNTLEPIEEASALIDGFRKGFDSMIVNFPSLFYNFRPYVDNAILSVSDYHNVHLYNLAAIAILDEMKMLFEDVVYQLSDHQAKAIDELRFISEKVLANMTVLEEQVNRVTLN